MCVVLQATLLLSTVHTGPWGTPNTNTSMSVVYGSIVQTRLIFQVITCKFIEAKGQWLCSWNHVVPARLLAGAISAIKESFIDEAALTPRYRPGDPEDMICLSRHQTPGLFISVPVVTRTTTEFPPKHRSWEISRTCITHSS